MYDNFFTRAKRTVYKWWCLVYKPVYVLIHHNWPEEKDPNVRYPVTEPAEPEAETATPVSDTSALAEDEIPAGVDADVLARANEIMARLNREAAEDEAKKNREIEAAKAKADEQARLAAILKANERNIDAFIQEGLSRQHPNT